MVLTTPAKVELVFKKAGTTKAIRLSRRFEAGRNVLTIRARLTERTTLAPGRYTLTVRASNKAGSSTKEKLRFRVVR